MYMYQPSCDMANGKPSIPAPRIAVTLWKAEYHHFAFLEAVMGNQLLMSNCSSLLDTSEVLPFPLSIVSWIYIAYI